MKTNNLHWWQQIIFHVNLTAAGRFYPLVADLLQTYLKYITIYIALLSEISRFEKTAK